MSNEAASDVLTTEEIKDVVKKALKDAGISAFITGARISIILPDGRGACFMPLCLDTQR